MLPHIVLIGIQGSGKGTQARLIREKFGYALFETGVELRKISRTDTVLGNSIRDLINNGHYVPAAYISDVIRTFIQDHKGTPILFDSPVRNLEQHEMLTPLLGDFDIIFLDIDREKATQRLLQRRVDTITGEVFSNDFAGDFNPATGNPLVKRIDDTPENIEKRIDWSIKETLPLLQLWEKSRTIYRINADQSKEKVFADISRLFS